MNADQTARPAHSPKHSGHVTISNALNRRGCTMVSTIASGMVSCGVWVTSFLRVRVRQGKPIFCEGISDIR